MPVGSDIIPAADSCVVQSATGNTGISAVMLAGATANVTGWRLLEVYSQQGLPIQVEIGWTGAQGGGQRALLTTGGGSLRFCFAGKAITKIEVTNRSDVRQAVLATVATLPGPVTTSNHYMTSEVSPGVAGFDVTPPPYADRVKILATSALIAAATLIELFDGLNQLTGAYLLNTQPANGESVSGVRRVRVSGVAGARYSIDFALGV